MYTKTINLRDMPEDIVRRAKACAAMTGVTLKDFVIYAISRAIEDVQSGMNLRSIGLAPPTSAKTIKGKR
jgi:uncharacterized protein (DUF1778 family)